MKRSNHWSVFFCWRNSRNRLKYGHMPDRGRESFANETQLREMVARRESKSFAAGFYYDVFKIRDAEGRPTGKVAKVFRVDRPERGVSWEKQVETIEADHRFCAAEYSEFIPTTDFVRLPTPGSERPFQFVAIQEDFSQSVSVKNYLAELGDKNLPPKIYDQLSQLLTKLETTLDQKGKILESFDLLGEKKDVVIDPKTNRVLLLDTNNVLERGTGYEFETWQGTLSEDPKLKNCLELRERTMRKLDTARQTLERYRPK